LTAAEQTLASVATLNRLTPFKEQFWQALTPDLTVRDFLSTAPTDELSAALMDGAPEALKQEQEKILTCKKKQWKN
jgi:hypothetical protein